MPHMDCSLIGESIGLLDYFYGRSGHHVAPLADPDARLGQTGDQFPSSPLAACVVAAAAGPAVTQIKNVYF